MIGAASTWESRQGLQKDENIALKWRLGEKISEKGVKIVKIGYLRASMHMRAHVCIRREPHAYAS